MPRGNPVNKKIVGLHGHKLTGFPRYARNDKEENKRTHTMKRIIIGTIALMMAMPSFADDTPATGDKKITSKNYVDTSVATKQNKIPAANTSGVGAGTSVITYTNVAGGGVIGERALFTGGEYTAGTDADKLITGSALNGAITSIPTTPTTTLECANQSGGCTLWTIVDQTAYGAGSGSGGTDPAILAMLQALVGTNGTGNCYKTLKNGTVTAGNCTTTPSNYGDWGVVFTYNNEPVQVSGISACSSLNEGLTWGHVASNQSQIDADYATSGGGNSANTNPPGGNCYCKLTDPSTSAARWVFRSSYSSSSVCADYCARYCGNYVRSYSAFRSGIFGAVAN